MQKLFFLITILLFAQMSQAQNNDDSYDALWKKVEKLEKDALPKSALEIVESISDKANKEQNSAQIVKSLLFSSKYAMTLQEDAQLQIINNFKTEIEKADFPTKNVLESYLANLYWRYFQENRYQFYNRTKTEAKVAKTDFRTWDLNTLFKEIHCHFEASLQQPIKLQKEGLEGFRTIMLKRPGSEIYRPTLFDLLAHTALNFYKSDENSITRPADKFEIDSPELLCEANQFVLLSIDIQDHTSLQAKALSIYQKLIEFHLNKKQYKAFVAVDIERLSFIYQNAVFPDQDERYLEVLQNSAEQFKNQSDSAAYKYKIAELYQQQGNSYDASVSNDNRWKLKKALALCETIISTYPKSPSSRNATALKAQIEGSNLNITTEKYLPSNKTARLLVTYENIEQLQLSAYKISEDALKQLDERYNKADKIAFIQKLPLVKEWEAALKNEMDYQQHGIEISIPPMENGHYLILAKVPDTTEKSFAYSDLQVTNMALIETQTPDRYNYQLVSRENGAPISDATFTISYLKDYNKPKRTKTLSTNRQGFASIPLSNENWSDVNIKVSYADEKATFGNYYINRKYDTNGPNKVINTSFLFSDRSIYRPGQPLFFKGILVETFQKKSNVLADQNVFIGLHDANGQKVLETELTTNEYGSFQGEFILPTSGLTGEFYMEVNADSGLVRNRHYFSVEEYKRPKFETSFEPITETYKVNDQVTVTGTATAYAGSQITDAKVTYRVRRTVYFPRWYYWYRPYFNTSPQEIAHGETITDAAGNYKVTFKALPDNSTSSENLPTFNYEVTADVTDINGETHSATTRVTVGYHALKAKISISENLDKDKTDNSLTLETKNLNGQFVPTKGTLKMYKLQAPNYVLRPRPWPAPDYKNWDKTAFKQLFPHDAFEDESEPTKWEKGALVWESNFDTGKTKKIDFGNIKKWASGKYILELEAKDKFGQLVKDKSLATVYSDKEKTLADKQLFKIKADKENYTIKDEAVITFSSAAKNLNVSVFIEKNGKIIDTQIIQLNDNLKAIKVPINTDDLGGFAVTYSFTAYNSFHSGSLLINVPYPSAELEIETLSFRDKIEPGTDETWSFKIKGPKGEKVSAELLASMYDSSLDAFKSHSWNFNPLQRPTYYGRTRLNAHTNFGIDTFSSYLNNDFQSGYFQNFNAFEWFGFSMDNSRFFNRRVLKSSAPLAAAAMSIEAEKATLEEVVTVGDESQEPQPKVGSIAVENSTEEETEEANFEDVQIRENLQETAFFFPQLQTDTEGNVSFSFTSPEALTKWKLQLLAHTKSLESTVTTLETVTQKELMVLPNLPRFLREGDAITVSTKIANLTETVLKGQAKLELIDVFSGADISNKLLNSTEYNHKEFSVDSLGNTQVSWKLQIPKGLQAVQFKIVAKAGAYSDGEQSALPVLSNRKLVTESIPMWVRSNKTKTFVLDKLKENTSTTLSNHALTLEITSNPAWYAVQALPYLMEYPYDCNEQVFSRYFANTLASHIANSNPRIQEVLKQWASSDALINTMEKNEELKSLLIQETPWLRDAQSESEQKKRIALLFNLDKMKNEQAAALNKLKNGQKPSGAWAWFNGGPDNRFITQHIVTGFGHLKNLKVASANDNKLDGTIENAIAYLDAEFIAEYDRMKKHAKNLNDDHLSQLQIHYLYMRSFFPELKTAKKVDEITAYYKRQAQKYWTKKGLFSKGMLALVLHRMEDNTTAPKIMRSLKENSITSEELGMYWKENTASWYWYQAPIETQALLIEVFSEIENDTKTIDNLKIWLLKNKQTNQWSTTKATSEAVYALLLQGSDWLSVTDAVDVMVGGEKIDASKLENVKAEAGTGYYKTTWNGNEITPEMAKVQLTKKGEGIAWGALYWQYFEDLDKITTAETPLQLKKKLFLKKNTATGEELSEVTDATDLKVGDLVRVRIELRSDREMEFVHMKDMRAAGFEPINVFSTYKWQDGLGYYEATKDASTNFFFDYLPKGVFVFEYDLRINKAGEFSNGITTIQSMYAPEFSSHSKGTRVKVKF